MTLPFEIAGGAALALARGLSVAGLLSVFGTTLARAAILPHAPAVLGAWRRLLRASLLLAWAATAAWVWLVAGTLADTPDLGDTAATVPVVLAHTLFGHVVLVRLALLAAVAAISRLRAAWPAAALAGLALASHAAHSHAISMEGTAPSWLLLSDLLHLLAAGAWLGGLLPLLLLVRATPADVAARACRRFSRLGVVCVAVLAGSAAFQGWVLIGGLPALVGTAYGLTALVKLALFAILLALAARHRFRLTPALSGGTPDRARRQMVRSIAAEAAAGLLVVLAAGVLSSLPPSMHVPPV